MSGNRPRALPTTEFSRPGLSSIHSRHTEEETHKCFSNVFEDSSDGKVHLELDVLIHPVQLPLRRFPIAVQDQLEADFEQLETTGVHERIRTPSEWVSSMVVEKNEMERCDFVLIRSFKTGL